MTEDDIRSAINGIVVKANGQSWILTVHQIDIRPPNTYVVFMRIDGPSHHRAEFVLNRENPADPGWLRRIAIESAQKILTGELPPETKEFL